MRRNITERRIDGKVRIMQVAAVVCALFAAIGIAHGIHTASPDEGWFIPIVAGVVAATGFAAMWHVLIGSVIGMVNKLMITVAFLAAVALTAIALGASAQAIATAVSGRSALAAELTAKVDAFANAEAEAYAQAIGFRGVRDAANVISHGLNAQADSEEAGGHGNGKGRGPKYTSLKDASQAFANAATAMDGMLEEAADEHKRAEAQLGLLRDAAAHGDQQSFMAATGEIGSAITTLNGIDPKPIIDNTGMVIGTEKGFDLSTETADFRAKGEQALRDRKKVEVPPFTPLSLNEATRAQMLGSALHGWILAGAIDVLPLFFLLLAFVFSREVWLNEQVQRDVLTREGRHEAEREVVKAMRPGDDPERVVPFRAAAE